MLLLAFSYTYSVMITMLHSSYGCIVMPRNKFELGELSGYFANKLRAARAIILQGGHMVVLKVIAMSKLGSLFGGVAWIGSAGFPLRRRCNAIAAPRHPLVPSLVANPPL